MKRLWYAVWIAALGFAPACFVPVNSVYEDAQLLKQGAVEIQGNASMYLSPFAVWDTDVTGVLNYNFGCMLGIGATDNFNLRVRYEYLKTDFWDIDLFDEEDLTLDWHYAEVSPKFSLIPDKLAMSTALGGYFFSGGGSIFIFDPRLIYTYRANDNFSLSVIPKLHFFFGEGGAFLMPGLTFGFGLSSDLDQWAIRPEVGYDSFVYAGVGFCYFINNKREPMKINE